MNNNAEQAGDKTAAIRPFHVNNVPEAELTELRRRINATKWPERETVTEPNFSQRGASPNWGQGVHFLDNCAFFQTGTSALVLLKE
jgi:hypothetical protein